MVVCCPRLSNELRFLSWVWWCNVRMYVFVNEKVASSNFFLIFFFDLRQAGTNRSKFSLLFRVLPAVSPRKNTYYAIATRETKKNLALAHPMLCDVCDFNSGKL